MRGCRRGSVLSCLMPHSARRVADGRQTTSGDVRVRRQRSRQTAPRIRDAGASPLRVAARQRCGDAHSWRGGDVEELKKQLDDFMKKTYEQLPEESNIQPVLTTMLQRVIQYAQLHAQR